ncbi:MAG TPA: SpoIIIAH-like family protein [Anaerovoracaceae bacterium]|nr:SpoIIIAH-like family protein [Anaerovoracaceae bacterium]
MSRIHLSRNLKRKTLVLLTMLFVVLAVGVLNSKLAKNHELEASKDYVNYEKQMLDEHDGEVLVDSINIAGLPGNSPEPEGQPEVEGEPETPPMESAIVITSDDISDIQGSDAYFAEIRATMDMDRNEILSMLTSVIAESGTSPEKDNATKQKLRIIEYMNTEKVVENLIVNKGFAEAFVVMTDTSVNVSVNKQDLNQSDVAKIMDVVIRETGRSADQIVIQNK